MEEAPTEKQNLWGPIALAHWRETPCIRGRVAIEDDVRVGRAVFYLDISEGQETHPVDLELPCPAILHSEDSADLPVIVIQVEEGIGHSGVANRIAGYRMLAGGNGICMIHELDLLQEPDYRFGA
jgi:hypothetical protein